MTGSDHITFCIKPDARDEVLKDSKKMQRFQSANHFKGAFEKIPKNLVGIRNGKQNHSEISFHIENSGKITAGGRWDVEK